VRRRLGKLPLTVVGWLIVALVLTGSAIAYFTTTGSGTAAATVSTLSVPASVAASVSGQNVSVTWNASTIAGSMAASSYSVERYSSTGRDLGAASCGPVASSNGSPNAFGSFTCADMPTPGTYEYKVTALYHSSWTAVSGFTNTTTVYAPDGSGTLTTSPTSALAASSGNTITFTYTAATGGTSSGEVDVAVPGGWPAPTTSNAAGCTTASTGTVNVFGQTIKVTGLTLAGGSTLTVTYGATSGGSCSSGDGATAPATTGPQTWTGSEKSISGGTMTNLASSPSVTVNNSPDGSGTVATTTANVLPSSTSNTIVFTYTAATGGMSGGEVDVAVPGGPGGWSAPTTSNAAGCSTASSGSVAVSGQTIKVTGVSLTAGQTLTITYGAISGGSCGAGDSVTAPSTTGAKTWTTSERSTAGGTVTNLTSSPSITVTADGSGSLTTPTTNLSATTTVTNLTFSYTAATSLSSGEVDVTVPSGWTAPTTSNVAGCTTASTGTVSVSGQTIKVTGVTLSTGGTLTVTYGSTGTGCGTGDGGVAASTAGIQTWTCFEKSSSTGTLTALNSSPQITVYAADGAGALSILAPSVLAGSTGNTVTLTYTAAAGGTSNGEVDVAVPSGWTAPVTSNAPGCTTASTGSVTVSGQTIGVTGVTLSGGQSLTITYGATSGGSCTSNDGATAGNTPGANTFSGSEKSTSGGTVEALGASPSVTVTNAADGSGALTTPTATAPAGSSGNTITFTYTAATGGTSNGEVDVAVPSGWTTPTTSNAPGCTTASTGTVSVSGQTIRVTSVTLAGASTLTVTYGSTGAGCGPGDGAVATSTVGAQTWSGSEKSTSGGTIIALASSPSITVSYSADGSGTLATANSNVSASSTGNTIAFTYMAAAGGMSGGEVDVAVPSGWTAPKTSNAAGCTTASTGTVSVSGQTIKVTGVTLAGGSTLTVTYGATSGGSCAAGDAVTAPSTTGAQTWTGSEKSTAGGSVTALASSPSVIVNAADGSGTLTTPITGAGAGATVKNLTFTYTAATGGTSNGEVDVVVPSGWTAPKTTNAAGCTTASMGTVSVSGQTIKVTGVTLTGGSTLTVTYGSAGPGCGPSDGATAPNTTGSQTWPASEKSTSGGTVTALASSPSIAINAADGSGTETVSPTTVVHSSTGNKVTFSYTAATGGMSGGEVDIAVPGGPSGWPTTPTTSNAAGCTTASTGSVTVGGGTIKVTGVTLSGGQTLIVTYGATSGGSCTASDGVSAPSSTGTSTFTTKEASGSSDTGAAIASSPTVTIS
jgi:hypothetical protein